MEVSEQKDDFEEAGTLFYIIVCHFLCLALEKLTESVGSTYGLGGYDCRDSVSFSGGCLKFMYKKGSC